MPAAAASWTPHSMTGVANITAVAASFRWLRLSHSGYNDGRLTLQREAEEMEVTQNPTLLEGCEAQHPWSLPGFKASLRIWSVFVLALGAPRNELFHPEPR